MSHKTVTEFIGASTEQEYHAPLCGRSDNKQINLNSTRQDNFLLLMSIQCQPAKCRPVKGIKRVGFGRLTKQIRNIRLGTCDNLNIPDLLGAPTETHSLDTFDWSTLGRLALNGHKQKKIILPGDVQIDLFIVTPPAQWGVIFLLRTGSDKFSHRFVTHKSFGGCMPAAYRMKDGAIWCKDRLIETPEEKDLFKLFDVRFIPPSERTA